MTMNEYQAKEDDLKTVSQPTEETKPTPESLRQSVDDVTEQISQLLQKRDSLKKKADDLALTKANAFYAGKWVQKFDSEYYHIQKVDEAKEVYSNIEKRPVFSCICDRSFAFTYFNGLRIYREPMTEVLTLDHKTKVLTSDEVENLIAKFRNTMNEALDDLQKNFR